MCDTCSQIVTEVVKNPSVISQIFGYITAVFVTIFSWLTLLSPKFFGKVVAFSSKTKRKVQNILIKKRKYAKGD